jgi:phytoene dehydrogenase-like protein
MSGRIHIGPEIDYLEKSFDASKYGEIAAAPHLDVTIPSLLDSSLAPEGKHVLSAYFQYAPYKLKEGNWKDRRGELVNAVIKTLSAYSPNLANLVEATHVITPLDLEATYGFTGGHIYHGELALDQIFTMRPVLDWARYQTPVRGLFLCGSGTHPGNGLTGASGANAAKEIIHELR